MSASTENRIVSIIMAAAAVTLSATIAIGVVDGRLTGGAPTVSGRSIFDAAGSGVQVDEDLDGGVLVIADGGTEIRVLDPADGSEKGRIELEREPATITPTPGGVSVFVTFSDSQLIEVYSTTEFEHETTITPEGGSERIPEYLTFSENGDTVFVTWRNSDSVSVYSHSMRELEHRHDFETAGGRGPIYRNRRATRLYRESDRGIDVYFAQNGEHIETISLPATPMDAGSWMFNGRHSHLWGTSAGGIPIVVDESDSRADVLEFEVASEVAPVVEVDSERALYVDEGRTGIVAFDARSGNQLSHETLEPEVIEELGGRIERLVDTGAGPVWVMGASGKIAVLDPGALLVVDVHDSGVGDTFAAVSSIVREDGNFACF